MKSQIEDSKQTKSIDWFLYDGELKAVKISANSYLFKVNYSNTTKRCEVCYKLATKTPERRH